MQVPHFFFVYLYGTFHLSSGLYSKGYKRMKVCFDTNDYDSMDFSPSNHDEAVHKKPKSTSEVVDYSDPFAIPDLLERIDCGKYGSVTKDIEAILARKRQTLRPYFEKYPALSNLSLEEKRQSKRAPKSANQQASPLAQNNVIDLEDDSVENNAPAALLPVVIIDSDEEQSEHPRPPYPFKEVVLPEPSYSFQEVFLGQPSEQLVVCMPYEMILFVQYSLTGGCLIVLFSLFILSVK